MSRWTVDAPTSLDFDSVTALQVRLIAGTVAVLATDDKPSVVVSDITGRPLQVSYEAGMLTIGYEALSWERLLDWLKPEHDTAAVTVTVPGMGRSPGCCPPGLIGPPSMTNLPVKWPVKGTC